MTNLTINDQLTDLDQSKGIKITKQISDIFELGKVAADYTNSFSLPNTPNNTKIMQGLGLDGNNSRIPYQITKAAIDTDGFSLINNGILSVGTTKGSYSVSVMDGNVNFMKLIENKTLGVDVDLSNFRHEKSLDTYVASLNNPYYRYLIADYGGKFGGALIYIDWQVPSFNVQKLFEAMIASLGWTFEMHPKLATFFDELWITYPTVPTYEPSADDVIATLYNDGYVSNQYVVVNGFKIVPSGLNWTSYTVTEGTLIGEWTYRVAETGSIKIDVSVEAYVKYYNSFFLNQTEYLPARLQIYKNGVLVKWFPTDPYEVVSDTIEVYATAGNFIQIYVAAFINPQMMMETHVNSINVTISKTNQGIVSATEAFKDFTLTQFFKEILWRTGLIPVPSEESNLLKFQSVEERMDTTRVKDWSEEFIEIESEEYTPTGMAQNNIFKMKYNDGQSSLNDGFIKIDNQNLPIEKTLGESKMFAPIPSDSRVPGNQIAVNAPLYSGSEKIINGETKLDYKPLTNRFYFLRRKRKTRITTVVSFFPVAELQVSAFDYATVENTLLDQLVFDNFSEYEKIFYAFKMQRVKFNLSLVDALQLRLDIPYYFRNAYWLLNSITFEEGELTKGEVVMINK